MEGEGVPSGGWESLQAAHASGSDLAAVADRCAAYAPHFARFGRGVVIHERCSFTHPHLIELHDDCRINQDAIVYGPGGVSIGRHARIGPRVFIHSANHDVSPDDPRAFHERGYTLDRVVIGDNCLLSANVSVMPGVRLGEGSFVAAGAVVTRGAYPPGSRLAGVPAREMGPARPRRARAPAALQTGLGRAAQALSAHRGLVQAAVSDIDASRASVRIAGAEAPITIEPGDVALPSGAAELVWTDAEGREQRAPIPAALAERWAPGVEPGVPVLLNSAEIVWHLCLTRLEKAPADARADERFAAGVVAAFLRRAHPASGATLADAMASQAGTGGADAPAFGAIADHREASTLGARALAAALAGHAGPPPWLETLVRAAKRPDLVALGAAIARVTGDEETLAHAHERLLGEEFFDRAARVPVVPASGSWAVTPLVAGALAAHALDASPEWRPRRSWTTQTPLAWSGFESADAPVRVEAGGRSAALVDLGGGRIAASLVRAWTRSVGAPPRDHGKFEIARESYEPVAERLGRAWEAAVRACAHAAGVPLVRLMPWPGSAHAAISVRYDIDRATPVQNAWDAQRQQTARFGGPCGTWYAMPGSPHAERLLPLLGRLGQEAGVHALTHEDGAEGLGITYHSAPGASYWSPARSSGHAERANAAHIEMLARQLTRPGPAWFGPDDSGRPCRVWSPPIHYPLEGSTADTDLAYFDRLLEPFEETIRLGGHAVIGTHPDLDQSLIDRIVERGLPRAELWAAPVGGAVARARAVLEGVSLVSGDAAGVTLLSDVGLADLAIEIDRPGGSSERLVTQLVPGVARAIGLLTEQAE